MALSLDEVHNIKFRMAKRAGYEVLDVDEFVDQVEASFEQMQDEYANLQRQLEALQAAEPGSELADGGGAGSHDALQASRDPADEEVVERPRTGEVLTVTTSTEASAAVTRLVQMSTEHAESVVAEAEAEAARIRAEADQSAKQVTTDATTRAERVESEAQGTAERVRSQAQENADELDRATEERRRELFADLEQERRELAGSVVQLRQFESEFRQNLTDQLHGYIDSLSTDGAEPSVAPAGLNEVPTDEKHHPTPADDILVAEAGEQDAADGAGIDNPGTTDSVAVTDSPEAAITEHVDSGDGSGSDDATGSDTPRLDALLNEQA